MKIQFLDQTGIASALGKLMTDFDEYYWAVAWGNENKFSNELERNKSKIKQLIFGTHYYGTDPKLLEKFLNNKYVRVMSNDSAGTFHPKVYLFITGTRAAAIVGSANFTNGAMTKNNEAAILVEGATTDELILSIQAMIEGSWKKCGHIDQDFLDSYRLRYNASKSHRDALERKRSSKKPKKDATHKKLRFWTWKEFAEMARKDRLYAFEDRLKLLQEARKMFSGVSAFSELSYDERQAIAGFLTSGLAPGPDYVMKDWGFFGSMFGMGDYKNLINNNNSSISDALDHIPLSGEIKKAQFDNYVVAFKKAFFGKSRMGGVPTASRLLAMKRPDTFICVNSENRTGLAADLGFSPTTLTFDKYWDEIIMPITESTWWQATRPKGQDGLLWDGRSAMLDSIYYTGKS